MSKLFYNTITFKNMCLESQPYRNYFIDFRATKNGVFASVLMIVVFQENRINSFAVCYLFNVITVFVFTKV